MRFNIIYFLTSLLTLFVVFFFFNPKAVFASCSAGVCPVPYSTFTHVWGETNVYHPYGYSWCLNGRLWDYTTNTLIDNSITCTTNGDASAIDMTFHSSGYTSTHSSDLYYVWWLNGDGDAAYQSNPFYFITSDYNDHTANGNDLTNHSASPSSTTGFTGSIYSVDFSGSSQYLTAASSNSFKQTGNFTVEAWFKTSAASYQHIVTVFDQNIANMYGYDIFIDNTGKINFEMGKNTGSTPGTDYKLLQSSNTWKDGNWHHLAVVYNGSTMQIFIDGTSDGSVAWSGNAGYPSTIYPTIGASANQPTPNEYWNGSLDDIRIWSTARTSAQINDYKNVELSGHEDGLAVYYPLETVPAPISSNNLADETGNGNNLTNNSAATNSASTGFYGSGYSMDFSGSSQYATAASSTSFKQTGNFTVEAWFKTSSATYQHLVSVFDQNSANIYGYDIFISNAGKINFEMGKNTGTTQGVDAKIVQSSNSWKDGNWHHLAAVYNGSTMELFIDGVSDGSVNWSNNAVYPSTIYPTIGAGANQPTPAEYWNGSLDDIRIWSTARTSNQINDNLNKVLTGSETGLAVYYPFEK